ncbi:MAG: phage shock protein PspC (stress-responsive transcriptional regulator) [Marinoscillum sp.]|jgi:phage shock protein PspC (stress-responsive transcriptional regulator)
MKKTISINIGSIIFHIEEDGYEKLKNYLDSVIAYFSSFEDSGEIISDIESRIAEIFLTKLADGRQTVNIEDVDELIATMGTTTDFEASIEPEDEPKKQTKEESKSTEAPAWEGFSNTSKRFYRDIRRKMLGGVASGIAHYFSVDPLWIRLLFLALLFNFFLVPLSGAALLGYIILWIVMPGNAFLEEDQQVKKLFRDGERRVIGGVASGIAAYFGTDTTVIRLLFVLSIFLGGAGIIAYIILWIISPEARSITEKMQMMGEPVTLSNIEQNVKKGLKVEEGEESALVKILLFPFRLIAIIINGLGKILGPAFKLIGEILRIGFGAFLSLLGFVLMVALTIALFGALGIGDWEAYVHLGDIPLALIQRSLDTWTITSAFVVLAIPSLALSLLGLVIILKRRVANAYVGWSLFSLWVLAVIFATFSIPRFAKEFAVEDDIRVEKTFPVTESIPTLKLNDLMMDNFNSVDLMLRGHSDSTYHLMLNIESRGENRQSAQDNAKQVKYEVTQKGDEFYFDSNITFPEEVPYRFQQVKAYFYIPFGKTFRMDEDLEEILVNTLHLNGYKAYQMQGNDWAFDRSGIKCLTCADRSSSMGLGNTDEGVNSDYDQLDRIDFPFEDFDEVEVAAYFDFDIRKGDKWQVLLRGDDDDLDEVYVNQVGEKLQVKFKEDNWEWWSDKKKKKIGLFIIMPELNYLELLGESDGKIRGFEGNNMTINAVGACDIDADLHVKNIEVSLTGASSLKISGSAEDFYAEVIGASRLEAFDLNVDRVVLEVLGASNAEVYARDELEIEAAGVSKVRYRGTENVNIDEAGISSIKRD